MRYAYRAGIMIGVLPRRRKRPTRPWHDGWYHTGDTAWCDEDGYFWYVGRIDDVIKSSGYRIGPFEIESVLLEHEACARVRASPACPTPCAAQAVKATVVLAQGFSREQTS